MPVLETVGVRHDGARELLDFLDQVDLSQLQRHQSEIPAPGLHPSSDMERVIATQQEVRRILSLAVREPAETLHADDAIDRVVLHPLWGMVVLALWEWLKSSRKTGL